MCTAQTDIVVCAGQQPKQDTLPWSLPLLQVLSWIDVCAGLAAKTLARGPCVTISVDAVHFFR
jgi:hypothetical protein